MAFRSSTRSSLCALLVALLLIVLSAPGPAHRPSRWYEARWISRSVRWRLDNDFPRGNGIRRAVLKGSRQWNKAQTRLRFRRRSPREAGGVEPCRRRRGNNFIHWKRIDGPGGKLALTVTCTFGDGAGPNEMYSFEMIFDREEPWHTDPSSRPDPLEVDLWAVASHEFGHAGGRISGGPNGDGHFSESSRFCPGLVNPRRHTMCPSHDVIAVEMRTLEKHDIDVFRRAYGQN